MGYLNFDEYVNINLEFNDIIDEVVRLDNDAKNNFIRTLYYRLADNLSETENELMLSNLKTLLTILKIDQDNG